MRLRLDRGWSHPDICSSRWGGWGLRKVGGKRQHYLLSNATCVNVLTFCLWQNGLPLSREHHQQCVPGISLCMNLLTELNDGSTSQWEILCCFSIKKQSGWVQVWLGRTKQSQYEAMTATLLCSGFLVLLSGATSWQEQTQPRWSETKYTQAEEWWPTARQSCSSGAARWRQAAVWVLKGRTVCTATGLVVYGKSWWTADQHRLQAKECNSSLDSTPAMMMATHVHAERDLWESAEGSWNVQSEEWKPLPWNS